MDQHIGDKYLPLPSCEALIDIDGLPSFSKAGRRDSVLIRGSLLEGPGNQFSDIDVYVVGASLPSMAKTDPKQRDWVWTSAEDIRRRGNRLGDI